MANFGSFMQGIGLAAGNNMIVGQQMEEQQASIDYKKSQVAMQKMQMLQSQQQMDNQKKEGEYFASQLKLDEAGVANPLAVARAATAAAANAAQHGDLKGMQEYSEMARMKTVEAKDAEDLHLKEKQEKSEAVSTAASGYSADPSEANAGSLIKSAIAAGVPPSTIPMGDPVKFRTWANNQQLASMTGKERVKFVADEADKKAVREETDRRDKVNEALRLEAQRQTAIMRAGLEEDRRLRREARTEKEEKAPHTIEGQDGRLYEWDPKSKLTGERHPGDPRYAAIGDAKLTAPQKQAVSRIDYSASEISRALVSLNRLVADPKSPFGDLHAGTVAGAFAKMGGNALTSTQSQMVTAVAGNLGNQITSMESALGGRMPAGTQQQHIEDISVRQAADTGYTALFKLANAKETAVTAIKHAPGHFYKTADGKRALDDLEKAVPYSTEEVIAMMEKDPKGKTQAKKMQEIAARSAERRKLMSEAPGTPAPSTPAGHTDMGGGWSVKAH